MSDFAAILAARSVNSVKNTKSTKKGPDKKCNNRYEKEKVIIQQVSCFADGNILVEQIEKEGRCHFLSFNAQTEEIKPIEELKLLDKIIVPIIGDEVSLGAVRLPSGAEEYGDTLSLLTGIEAHICHYLDVNPTFLRFAAYYILLTWLYDKFNTLPYLRALGDTGTGKSRFLDVIGGLTYKPISVAGCVTPAPIYRMLRKWGGTLILDEADMKSSDEYNEVVTILNCGFETGRPVIRATKDNPDRIQILPVFGPKVFATRRRFKDVALEARCLTEIMTETDRDDIPPVLGRHFYEEQHNLKNKLLMYRFRNYFNTDPEAGAAFELHSIEPRLRQISDSFSSLFANEPDVLEDFKMFISGHQRELIEQRATTREGMVVNTLFDLLNSRDGTTGTIGTSATGVNEPGQTTGISASEIAEKVEMTPQSVGAILKGLGLKTKLQRRHGERRREVIYKEGIFSKLRKRYIMEMEEDEEDEEEDESSTLVPSTEGVVPVVSLVPEQHILSNWETFEQEERQRSRLSERP